MVSIPETRELLLLLILIAGLSGVFVFVDNQFDGASLVRRVISQSSPLSTPTLRTPRVLGVSTKVLIVANPVVHIHVPKHNIFELQ